MNYRTLLLISPIALGLTASKPAPRFEKVFELKPEEGRLRIRAHLARWIAPSPMHWSTAPATAVSLRQSRWSISKDKKVQFTEPGIDAYWSNDGQRMIYLSFAREGSGVTMRHHATGKITRDVAPQSLGDYFSWAVRDNKNLILTINSNYYYLDGDQAVLPHSRVPVCPDIGARTSADFTRSNAGHDIRTRHRCHSRSERLRFHARYRHSGCEGRFLLGQSLCRDVMRPRRAGPVTRSSWSTFSRRPYAR